MCQSGRAGDEAKRHNPPAKSGRVGITVVTSLWHFRYILYTMSKWWETMKIHQAKSSKQNEGLYPVKRILRNPFSFYVFPTPAFSSF